MKKRLLTLLFSAAAILLLCGFTFLQPTNYRHEQEITEPIQNILITDDRTTVTVESADIDTMQVEYVYTDDYTSPQNEPLYDITAADGTLTITKHDLPEQRESFLYWLLKQFYPEDSLNTVFCKLFVRVPRAELASLTVSTTQGTLALNDVAAQSVSLSDPDGDIRLNGGSFGTVTIASTEGDVVTEDAVIAELTEEK